MAVHDWRARDNRHELKPKRFRLTKRKNVFTWRKVSQGNMVPQRLCSLHSPKMVNLIWTSFVQEVGRDLLRSLPICTSLLSDLLPSENAVGHQSCCKPSNSPVSLFVLALAFQTVPCLLGYIKEAFMLIDISKFHHPFLLLSFLYPPFTQTWFFALRGCIALRFISMQYGGQMESFHDPMPQLWHNFALRDLLSLDIYCSGENRSTGPSHHQNLLVQKMVERGVSQFGPVRSVSTSVKI